jgi:hypothetical protein
VGLGAAEAVVAPIEAYADHLDTHIPHAGYVILLLFFDQRL